MNVWLFPVLRRIILDSLSVRVNKVRRISSRFGMQPLEDVTSNLLSKTNMTIRDDLGSEKEYSKMSATLGDTFLTESRTKEISEPDAMVRVREDHSRLQEVVFSLNKKISLVLAKQEGDFLAAYRAHMYSVQKELQTLRQRVIEAENELQVHHCPGRFAK